MVFILKKIKLIMYKNTSIFWIDLNKSFKRFSLPLKMSHDGLLEFNSEKP